MEQKIYFMPLGGGQRVGASCYYLRLGESNLILDAGIGIENGVIFEPDTYSLITSPFLQSMGQIDHIYISHAHSDHIGYLFRLMKEATRASVYMTEITAILSEYQLYDKNYLKRGGKDEEKRLAAQYMLDKIAKVSYMKTIDFGKYKAMFLPAGHIPGAMMILFEFEKRKILYTGDFSLDRTALTGGCIVPDQFGIDTVIMCGLHAKHPSYIKRADGLFKTVKYILKTVWQKRISVKCHVQQLSKGVEFLKTLNEYNTRNTPVYLDKSVMDIVEKMEQLSIPVLNVSNRPIGSDIPMEPHIYVTAGSPYRANGFYYDVNVDFSLHGDFSDMKEFIKRINPEKVILVHCAKEYSPFDDTIEQALMLDGDCRTQVIFAEEKEAYVI